MTRKSEIQQSNFNRNKMTVKKILDNILRSREQKRQYSQHFLAQQMGITQKAYSKIETGETKLTVQHLLQITEILQIELFELLEIKRTFNDSSDIDNGTTSEDHKHWKDLYERLLQSKDREIDILTRYINSIEINHKERGQNPI